MFIRQQTRNSLLFIFLLFLHIGPIIFFLNIEDNLTNAYTINNYIPDVLYYMYASSDGTGETAQSRLSPWCSHMQQVPKSCLLASILLLLLLLLLLYRQTAQTRMRRLTSTSKLLRSSAVGLRFGTAPNQGDFGDFHWDFRLSPIRYRLTHHTPWNKPYTTHPTQPNLI